VWDELAVSLKNRNGYKFKHEKIHASSLPNVFFGQSGNVDLLQIRQMHQTASLKACPPIFSTNIQTEK
jgi:hypothetical protein